MPGHCEMDLDSFIAMAHLNRPWVLIETLRFRVVFQVRECFTKMRESLARSDLVLSAVLTGLLAQFVTLVTVTVSN